MLGGRVPGGGKFSTAVRMHCPRCGYSWLPTTLPVQLRRRSMLTLLAAAYVPTIAPKLLEILYGLLHDWLMMRRG